MNRGGGEPGEPDPDQQWIALQRAHRHYAHRFAIDEAQAAQASRHRVDRLRIVHAIHHDDYSNENCSHCSQCVGQPAPRGNSPHRQRLSWCFCGDDR